MSESPVRELRAVGTVAPTQPAADQAAMLGLPPYPTDRPLFVFDGVCALCSRGAAWLMRHDRRGQFYFTSAQSPLGQALYRHHGLAFDDTYLLVDHGKAWNKSDGYLHMLGILGGAWKLLLIFRLIPRPARDWAYDLIARNRYRWFGKVGYCELIPGDWVKRLL
jgi:predicted DCC family thiol-disulfide oxidoreductase YuxK